MIHQIRSENAGEKNSAYEFDVFVLMERHELIKTQEA